MHPCARMIAHVWLATVPAAIAAQRLATEPIDSGVIVRMRLANAESVRGRLLQKFIPSDATLTFCRYPAAPCASLSGTHVQTLPATQVTSLEVAHGNHLFRGAVIGSVIGGAIAALFIDTVGRICESDCDKYNREVALTTVGLGLGLGVAFGSQSLVWRPAP